ncbi:MAG: hypothetical protein ACLFMO_05115 [Eubacteriales bacterium]
MHKDNFFFVYKPSKCLIFLEAFGVVFTVILPILTKEKETIWIVLYCLLSFIFLLGIVDTLLSSVILVEDKLMIKSMFKIKTIYIKDMCDIKLDNGNLFIELDKEKYKKKYKKLPSWLRSNNELYKNLKTSLRGKEGKK